MPSSTIFSPISLTMMTSQATVTKSLTLGSLTEAQRERAIELIAERQVDNMSTKDLIQFATDVITCYYNDSDDIDLINDLEDYTTEEEFAEFVNEA